MTGLIFSAKKIHSRVPTLKYIHQPGSLKHKEPFPDSKASFAGLSP
jgi:hypothetical protein